MSDDEIEEMTVVPTTKIEAEKSEEELAKETKKKEKVEKVSFFHLFRYATGFDYLLMFLGSIGAAVTGMAVPAVLIIFGRLIDDLNKSTDDMVDNIVATAVYYLYIGVAAWIASYGESLNNLYSQSAQRACWMTAAERQAKKMREEFLKAILRQEIAWFDFIGTGALTSRVASDTILISEGIGEKVGSLIQHISTFVGGFISGYLQGWQLSLVMTAITPLLAATGAFLVHMMSTLSTKGQKAYANAGAVATEVISGMRTVASFSGEERSISKYSVHLQEASRIGTRKGFMQGFGMGVTTFTWNASYALCLWYGGVLVVDHGYTGGEIITILFSIIVGAFALGQGGPCMEAIGKAQGAAFKIFQTIDRVPEIDASSDAGLKLKSVKGNIRLKKLHFEYPSRKEVKVLRGFNLKIKAGQTVALVGHSGCGKSSIVSLIQRFYDPTNGKIVIDGTDIKELNLRWWRQQIGLVGQEPVLFTGTIAENIAYGKEGATREEIETAAKAANAHNFIKEFPEGYETQCGEKGAQLSGGQKQRIAIARAIIKNPKILLLDEATSALDSESEKVVQQALDSVMKERTTLVIAHRLSTIKNADMIVVVKDGVVAEKGKHDELMAAKGFYHELVHAQAAAHSNELDNTQQSKRTFDLAASLDQQKSADDLDIIDETVELQQKEVVIEFLSLTLSQKDVPISRLVALNKPEIPHFLAGSFGAAVVGTLNPLFALLFSHIINIYFKPENEIKEESAKWAIYFIYLAIAAFVGSLCQGFFFGYAGEKLVERARQLTFTRILRNNIGFFDKAANTTGILTSRLASDATLLESMLGARLGLTVQNLVTVGVGLGIAFSYGWKLTLVILATAPLIAGSNGIQVLTMNGFAGRTRKAVANANQIATEAIANIRTVAAFVTEDKVLASFQKQLEAPFTLGVRTAHISGFFVGLSQFVLFAVDCLAFWYGGKLIKDGELVFLDFMVVLFAIILSAMALGQSSAMAPDASKGKQAAKAIFQLIDHKPDFDSFSPEGKMIDNETFEGKVELKDVKFRYPTRPDSKVLRGLSLSITPGQVVALVGPSGCGKSSLISLIERFYDVDGGEVLIDGININQYNIKSLRSHIGLVGQEPVLFSGTIAENIAYGKNGATQEEIETAAKAANAHKFISHFPDGYETQVGEKGAQLSGGQKQRIAIARAIIKNPKILLLDEATSALDSESEKVVQKALDQVMKGRTTIVVAHRLSTIKNADQIAVIYQGKVEELGTHDELMKEGGLYYSLAARQSV